MTVRPWRGWLAIALAVSSVGLLGGLSRAAAITGLTVTDLTPLTIAFDLEHEGSAPLPAARGVATLSELEAGDIEQFAVESLPVPAGGRVHVEAASRWEFQLAGIYVVDVALDLGPNGLVSASLRLRIAPVRLPLGPRPEAAADLTLVQEPVNWGLTRVHAQEVWAISHGSSNVVVAVIDSGIDRSIPQLAEAMWLNEDEVPANGVDDDRNGYVDDVHGWDFRDGDASSLQGTPLHGHGTVVASILAARPGRYPVVGVAPGVRLMDVRFLDSSNAFRSADWKTFERAIGYAVDNGADLINLSIYANGRPPASFEKALQDAQARGVVIVGITGNQGQAEVMYPGRFSSVLAVSALGQNGQIAGFSNRGADVAICAPGDMISAFTAGGRVVTLSGTSYAAPHVTGVLALMLSAVPNLSPARAVEILLETASDLGPRGRDDAYGDGLVDAAAAVSAGLGR
ncbi:MAG: S8 family serine peptidase [Candidatus Bipolaricaulota bacterium]